MKTLILISLVQLFAIPVLSQGRYYTKTGQISFEAGTALEDIDAHNNAAASVLDINTGQVEYAVLIKGFEFKRALMQEHFNENYLESDKFPKAVLRGKLVDTEKINFQKDGTHAVVVKGPLEIHGVKKEVEVPGTLQIAGQTISTVAEFTVSLSDYNISIPGLVRDKISKTVTIKVKCTYSVLK